eukprot:TRINITY_DN51724_c0_g2_i2.p1 TRINITY_DN51724_c0_g2~~TRINITY_DN51724_c0_g2_i2.p1  ORF type:complete len:511 (+),score=109.26 TRINITY_DN51724_c0_g2_i2:151-1683(+)
MWHMDPDLVQILAGEEDLDASAYEPLFQSSDSEGEVKAKAAEGSEKVPRRESLVETEEDAYTMGDGRPGLRCSSGIMYRSLDDDEKRCGQPWVPSTEGNGVAFDDFKLGMDESLDISTGERRLVCGGWKTTCNQDVALRFSDKSVMQGRHITAAGTRGVTGIAMEYATSEEAKNWQWLQSLHQFSNDKLKEAAVKVEEQAAVVQTSKSCERINGIAKWMADNAWWIFSSLGSLKIFSKLSVIPGSGLIGLIAKIVKAVIQVFAGMSAGPCSSKSMDCGAGLKVFKAITQAGILFTLVAGFMIGLNAALVIPGVPELVDFLIDGIEPLVAALIKAVWGVICSVKKGDTLVMIREVIRVILRGEFLLNFFVELDAFSVGDTTIDLEDKDTGAALKMGDVAVTWGKDLAVKLKTWAIAAKPTLQKIIAWVTEKAGEVKRLVQDFVQNVTRGLESFAYYVEKALGLLPEEGGDQYSPSSYSPLPAKRKIIQLSSSSSLEEAAAEGHAAASNATH